MRVQVNDRELKLTKEGRCECFLGADVNTLAQYLKTQDCKIKDLDFFNALRAQGNIEIITSALIENTTVLSLSFSTEKVNNDAASALSALIRQNKTMTKLALENCKITKEGMEAIGKALQCNNVISAFSCTEHKDMANVMSVTAAEILKKNTAITDLNLSCSYITRKEVMVLAEALQFNNTLKFLDISFNSLRDKGVSALAKMLMHNTSLISLNIAGNDCESKGAKAIGEMLMVNTTLKTLDIHQNGLGLLGGRVIGNAIELNTTLTSLDLSNAKLGDLGVQAISKALATNSSLIALNLLNNQMMEKECRAVADSLKKNHTLLELKLSWNGAPAKVLYDALQLNKTLLIAHFGLEGVGKNNRDLLVDLMSEKFAKVGALVEELYKDVPWETPISYAHYLHLEHFGKIFFNKTQNCEGFISFEAFQMKWQDRLDIQYHYSILALSMVQITQREKEIVFLNGLHFDLVKHITSFLSFSDKCSALLKLYNERRQNEEQQKSIDSAQR